LRLISSNGVEIGAPGIDSPFLDTILTDHPHKVATISIPFSDKAILDFARNVANPDCELSRSVARKIVVIYKHFGIDIEVDENEINNSETRMMEDDTDNNDKILTAQVEPKYIIKIEIEPPASRTVGELASSSPNIDDVPATVQILVNDQYAVGQTRETDLIVTGSPNQHEDLEAIDSTEGNLSVHYEDETNNDLTDQASHYSCNNIAEADFSFHDLEEEPSQEVLVPTIQPGTQNMTPSTSNEVDNVISNIIQTSSQFSIPCEVTSPPSTILTDKLLTLRFVKNGVFPIKDMAKKRKQKRGQN